MTPGREAGLGSTIDPPLGLGITDTGVRLVLVGGIGVIILQCWKVTSLAVSPCVPAHKVHSDLVLGFPEKSQGPHLHSKVGF